MVNLTQLHLVELMLADVPARILTGRTGFAPEVRRVGAVLNRQQLASDDFIAIEVGHRHFRGGNEKQLVVSEGDRDRRQTSAAVLCPEAIRD